ncbi:MAG: hypothetical protein JO255_12685 [Alphaproteobacteria bacterium]|nr:hypothetical protein [Alphaproteobacteria bacterium]
MTPLGLTRYGGDAVLVDVFYVIALGATSAVTLVMYRRVEKPSREAARRLIDRWMAMLLTDVSLATRPAVAPSRRA